MAELIRLGAYRAGADPDVDQAMRLFPKLDAFMRQDKTERTNLDDGYNQLAAILSDKT